MTKQDTSENQAKNIYLGIGSNLGNRITNIEKAKSLLEEKNIKLISFSKYYETPSWPNPKNPKFINIVLKTNCQIKPSKLLSICKSIEVKLGRKKAAKNSPRVCDIDIIDFNGLIINKDDLKIPHKKCHLRNFVLYPILQIDAEWVHPKIQKNVKFLINNLDQKSRIEITRLNKNVIIKS